MSESVEASLFTAMHDTEDRHWWYRHGERQECAFIQMMKERGFEVARNPEKYLDPSAPDLVVEGKLSDLKTQNTPFFTAARFGIDPQYTITFNRKDYRRYTETCPEVMIYFWANWTQTGWNGHRVEPMNHVYEVGFKKLEELLFRAPIHFYERRKNEVRPNALSSFLIDARDLREVV